MKERQSGSIQIFPVLGEPAATIEPSNGTFNNPTLWQGNEAWPVRTFDDFDDKLRDYFGCAFVKNWSLIPAIGKKFAQQREAIKQIGQQQKPTVTILHRSRCDDAAQQ